MFKITLPKKLINNLFFILYLLCCVGFVLFVGFFFNPFPTGVLAGWGDEKR